MKSIRYIILFSLLSIALNGYCQQPTPSSLTQIWVLKSDGEVTSLLEPTPTPTQVPPDLIIDLPGGVTMEFMQIPAGSFLMGSTDDANWSWCIPCEQPMHEVTIGYDFYMGQFEVTQAQWLAMMGSWPYRDPADDNYGHGDNYPAYFISWDDCQNFITELNKLGQGTFRLPSEAEWEYACRAGTTSRFYFGDSVGCATR